MQRFSSCTATRHIFVWRVLWPAAKFSTARCEAAKIKQPFNSELTLQCCDVTKLSKILPSVRIVFYFIKLVVFKQNGAAKRGKINTKVLGSSKNLHLAKAKRARRRFLLLLMNNHLYIWNLKKALQITVLCKFKNWKKAYPYLRSNLSENVKYQDTILVRLSL